MPNLKQLSELKSRYGDTNHSSLRKSDVETLLESFDPTRLEKGFPESRIATRTFSFPSFRVQDYVDYFLERKKARVVLLFIDITAFSTKFINKTSDDLVIYLDQYYQKVIPIINQHGGEIEKIMGDGIICVFGEPFLDENLADLHGYADRCSRKIIKTLKGTEFAVKIGLHCGEIMYYQNPCDEYFEYTMIGNALTDLFRLESMSKPNSVNFYGSTYYDQMIQRLVASYEAQAPILKRQNPATWLYKGPQRITLSEVSYNTLSRIELT